MVSFKLDFSVSPDFVTASCDSLCKIMSHPAITGQPEPVAVKPVPEPVVKQESWITSALQSDITKMLLSTGMQMCTNYIMYNMNGDSCQKRGSPDYQRESEKNGSISVDETTNEVGETVVAEEVRSEETATRIVAPGIDMSITPEFFGFFDNLLTNIQTKMEECEGSEEDKIVHAIVNVCNIDEAEARQQVKQKMLEERISRMLVSDEALEQAVREKVFDSNLIGCFSVNGQTIDQTQRQKVQIETVETTPDRTEFSTTRVLDDMCDDGVCMNPNFIPNDIPTVVPSTASTTTSSTTTSSTPEQMFGGFGQLLSGLQQAMSQTSYDDSDANPMATIGRMFQPQQAGENPMAMFESMLGSILGPGVRGTAGVPLPAGVPVGISGPAVGTCPAGVSGSEGLVVVARDEFGNATQIPTDVESTEESDRAPEDAAPGDVTPGDVTPQ